MGKRRNFHYKLGRLKNYFHSPVCSHEIKLDLIFSPIFFSGLFSIEKIWRRFFLKIQKGGREKMLFFRIVEEKFFAEGYQNTGILYLKKYMGEEEQSEKDEKFLL